MALLLASAAMLGAPTGWIVSDHLERNNDFCNACHLAENQPLHAEIRHVFDGRPAASLAAAHAVARVEGRDAPLFRCIDCHGGAGPLGRARVKALAASDAFFYVLGRFEEPKSMRFPLQDSDCAKCHARFEASERRAAEGTGSPPFHALPVHNSKLGIRCVECHLSHELGGEAEAYFLNTDSLRAQCARCHSEFSLP